MRIILIIAVLLAVSSCRTPLPPCTGNKTEIYQCESLRLMQENNRRLRYMQSQQASDSFKRQWDRDTKVKSY